MVTETETVADLVPPETQTEEPPSVELVEPAAEPEPEAAAPEPQREAEKPLTRADIEALIQQQRDTIREEVRREERERGRRERQREGALRQQEEERRRREQQDVEEVMRVELHRLGLDDADHAPLTPLLERYAAKRESHVTQRTLAQVGDAFTAAAADILGLDHEADLTPDGERYRQILAPFVQDVYDRTRKAVLDGGDYVLKADMEKLVDAEIARRNANARKNERQLQQPTGAPSRELSFDDLEHLFAVGETTDVQEREYMRLRALRGLK